MKKIEHPLFSFEVPDAFDQQILSEIIALSRSNTIPHKSQPPFIRLNLEEIKDLNNEEIKGATLAEKMVHYYLDENSQDDIGPVEEIKVNGLKTLKFSAKVHTKVLEKEYDLHYLFASVLIDDTDFISFIAIHEVTEDGVLQDWANKALNSVIVLSNLEQRKAAYEAYEKRFDTLVSNAETKLSEAKEDVPKVFEVSIPEDGKECFRVGDFDFEILAKDTKMYIGEMSRELVVEIKAKTTRIKEAVAATILDDYPDDGIVSIMIPAKGIHVNGVPEGELQFEEGKTNAPLFMHSRIDGFDYKLDLNAVVRFEKGWFLLKGEMTKSYHDKSFPIHICKKFNVEALNWNEYQFTTMEEVTTAKPENVRFLYLQNPNFIQLPDSIFTFTNLEDLTISSRSNSWDNEKLPLKVIQPEIEILKNLKSLHISGASVEKLPEQIANLKELEQLGVANCELTTVSEGIFELPKLKYLWISANQISKIPEEIDLPELTHIHLEKNHLKTLPEALAKQPKLKKIKLEDNPLENLPELFNQVAEIELSMEDKLRLLNYDYNGADGKGLVEWDDTMFWSKNDQALMPEIKNVIKENKLDEHGKALISLVKKSIGFQHTVEEDYAEIGNHRFGGMPDLPDSIPYPRFGENWREGKDDNVYEFIGQINCTEIAHLQEYLPRTGMLFFFLETIHSIYGGDNNPGKVIYVDTNESLSSGKRFQFTEDDYFEMVDGCFQGYKADAEKMNSVPSMYASYVNKHLFLGEAETLKDNRKLQEDLANLFEYPINENTPYEYAINSYGFTQHENPELQASLGKKGNPEDWLTLLTVTSAGDMQWGDAGDLFFVIHKSDLAKCDFTNVFVTMESS